MAKHPRLQQRKGRYYVRAKVPAELVPIIGKKEIVQSLGTSNHKEALERVRTKSVEIDSRFRAARQSLSPQQKSPPHLDEHEATQLALLWFVERNAETAREQENGTYMSGQPTKEVQETL